MMLVREGVSSPAVAGWRRSAVSAFSSPSDSRINAGRSRSLSSPTCFRSRIGCGLVPPWLTAAGFAAVAAFVATPGLSTAVILTVIISSGLMTVVRNGVQGACLKSRNLRANPRVSISIWDNEDPNRYLEVEGNASLGEKCAGEHINDLSLKYEGIDFGTPDKSRDRTREAGTRTRPTHHRVALRRHTSLRHSEDDLPAHMAGLDEPMRRGRIGERKRLHHLYPQEARLVEVREHFELRLRAFSADPLDSEPRCPGAVCDRDDPLLRSDGDGRCDRGCGGRS
jgi:hypothetical protein